MYLQSWFFCIGFFCIFCISVYYLAVFFFLVFAGTLMSPVNQCNSVKPLAEMCVSYHLRVGVLVHIHKTNKTGTIHLRKKKKLHSATRGQKLLWVPLGVGFLFLIELDVYCSMVPDLFFFFFFFVFFLLQAACLVIL